MALPQDGQDANGLTKVTQIPAGKELMFIDPTTNEGGIITLEDLTKQILNGLTSQTFGLDSGTQTLPAAINYLYGKSFHEFNGNIDLLSDQYIVASTAGSKGSLPTELVGNRYIIIGDTLLTDTGLQYGVQFAFSFGSSKIAIRNCNFNSDSVGKYSDWRYI